MNRQIEFVLDGWVGVGVGWEVLRFLFGDFYLVNLGFDFE